MSGDNTKNMFRQVTKQTALKTTASINQRSLATTNRLQYGVVDSAKEALKKANKVVGEYAASGIDAAQKAGEKAPSPTDVADKANKKTGKVLADGMQTVEDVKPVDAVKNAAETVNKKTGEVLADGMQTVEDVKPVDAVKSAADTVNKKTGKVLADGMEKAQKLDVNATTDDIKSAAEKTARNVGDAAGKASNEVDDVIDEGKKAYERSK